MDTSLKKECKNGGVYQNQMSQVIAVEQELQIESSEKIHKNYTLEELQTAAEMFIYFLVLILILNQIHMKQVKVRRQGECGINPGLHFTMTFFCPSLLAK